jgi:hypothetical protein
MCAKMSAIEKPTSTLSAHGAWRKHARIVHLLIAVVGLGVALALPARLGFAQILALLRPALAVLPLCILLEIARVLCEAIATRLALGRAVPLRPMVFAHLASYAVSTVFPAPRPAAEAVKTSILGPFVGAPEAAVAGTVLQAATFFSVGLVSLLGSLCLWGSGASVALLVNATLLLLLGGSLRGLLRSVRLRHWLVRKWPLRSELIVRLHLAACRGHLLVPGPSLCLLASLGIRIAEQAILETSMGGRATVRGAVGAEGVRLLGASIGVLVPGQSGVREGVFALSASALGKSEASATAIALYTHLVELSLASVGFLALALFRMQQRAAHVP